MGKKSRRRPAGQKTVSPKAQVGNELNEEASKNDEPPPPKRPQSIHELDDLEAAVAWMSKGRVDTKGFAKHLPHTAQALQDGKVTPECVAKDLEGVYDVTTCRLETAGVTPMKGIAYLSACSALPDIFFRSESQRADMSVAFGQELETRFIERARVDLNPEDSILLLKECVDETCEKWAPRLDRELFRGRKGTFLKKCPLYGVTPDEYSQDYMPMRRLMEDNRQKQKQNMAEFRQFSLLNAAQNVANGFHDLSRTCWECKAVCQELKACAKCEAAQYCSRECQRSAWKEGHKHKCELLKLRYAALEDSLQAMDIRYSLNNELSLDEYESCQDLDFHMLDVSFVLGLPINWCNESEWGIPSMRRYYEKLERIVVGEFWFFPNASEALYQEAHLDQKIEKHYFLVLCRALCFEYNMLVKVFIRALCEHTAGGVQMPASIFKQIYFRQVRRSEDPADRFRVRRDSKRNILWSFVENHHK